MRTSGFSEDIAAKEAVEKLLAEGSYLALLISIEESRSKAGNNMLVARWAIRNGETDMEIVDYLTDAKRTALRLRHLAGAFSDEVLAKYESGSLEASDFAAGTMVMVHVIVERARRPYPEKNAVGDYSAAKASTSVVTPFRAAG